METRLDTRTERRLVGLLAARLALSLLIFGVALGMDALGRSLAPDAKQGLYWVLGFAFLATAVSGATLRRIRHADRFGAVQVATDTVLATGLVAFSGGADSVFTFLYIVVAVYGAVLFQHRGAVGAASLCALGYGGVLLAGNWGWLDAYGGGQESLPILGALWAVHVGALFLVGALASVLAGELRRTGAALDQRNEDLWRLQNLHERTVESLMSGLLTIDSSERITSFNPEAGRITGADSDQVIGCHVEDVIPGASEVLGETHDHGASSLSTRARLPYRNRRGEDRFLGMAASILRGEDGRSLGFVLIFQDVTQIVTMEEELRVSERLAAVGELSAKIAHEIRNPLAAISGSIQILNGARDDASDEERRLMNIVVRETDRLNDLITDFLTYARPRPPQLTRVDLKELVEDLLEVFEASRPEGVAVSMDSVEPHAVAADPGQLRQALWNLVLNGVQAMPEGGELVLSVGLASRGGAQGRPLGGRNTREDGLPLSVNAETVEIAVSDTGVGMSAEVQEHMLEPFFTTRSEGSGLGLSTVYRIVESHGGALLLDSEPGRGSTFRIQLPPWEEPS